MFYKQNLKHIKYSDGIILVCPDLTILMTLSMPYPNKLHPKSLIYVNSRTLSNCAVLLIASQIERISILMSLNNRLRIATRQKYF